MPWVVGALGVAGSLTLFFALQGQQQRQLDREVAAQAAAAANEIDARLEARIIALERSVRRWQLTAPTHEEWRVDAELILGSFPGFAAITWVDPALELRWVAPESMIGASRRANLGEPTRRALFESAAAKGSTVVSQLMDLQMGGRGFGVIVPMFHGETLDGFQVGLFRIEPALRSIFLEPRIAPGYGVAVMAGEEEVFSRSGLSGPRPHLGSAPLEYPSPEWSVAVWPEADALAAISSPLPESALAAGLLLTLALFFAAAQALAARSHAIALALEGQERQSAEEARRATERRYRRLVELSQGYLLIHNFDGTLRWVNQAASRALGYEPAEIEGRSFREFIAPRFRTAFDTYLRSVRRDALATGLVRVIDREGREHVWSYRNSVHSETGEEDYVLSHALDLSDRVALERTLRSNEAAVRELQKIASDRRATFDEKVRGLLELGCRRFELEIGILARIDGERYEVVQARSQSSTIAPGDLFELGKTYCRETVRSPEPIGFAHAGGGEYATHPAYQALGLEAYLGSAVTAGARPYGTLNFSSPAPRKREFTTADKEFVALMAQWLGAELEQRRSHRELSVLVDLGETLQMCGSLAEAYAAVPAIALRLFPDEAGAVFLEREDSETLDLVAHWDQGTEAEAPQPAFARAACWALRQGRPRIFDPAAEVGCRHLPPGTGHLHLCVPMAAMGDPIGLLLLSRKRSPSARGATEGWSDAEVQLAMAVADTLGRAVSNLRLQETLREQSIRDPLTGLLNRRHFEEALEREIHRAERHGRRLAVALTDLDRFKAVNDQHGHDAGDAVLRSVSRLLLQGVRASDIACRLGGDEFCLVLPEVEPEAARQRAEAMRGAVRQVATVIEGRPLPAVSVSIGLAIYPDHASDAESLMRAADRALYQAKAKGGNAVAMAVAVTGTMSLVDSAEREAGS